jgi:hypothetical protein
MVEYVGEVFAFGEVHCFFDVLQSDHFSIPGSLAVSQCLIEYLLDGSGVPEPKSSLIPEKGVEGTIDCGARELRFIGKCYVAPATLL